MSLGNPPRRVVLQTKPLIGNLHVRDRAGDFEGKDRTPRQSGSSPRKANSSAARTRLRPLLSSDVTG
jgi:hypothetical protein